MLKIFGRLVGLKDDDLKYDSEALVFTLIGIAFFMILGIFKSITKEDILTLQLIIQNIFTLLYLNTNFDFSYISNIAEYQNDCLLSIIYLSIAFLMVIKFIILKFICKIGLDKHGVTNTSLQKKA
ncbi:hypothetical protein OW763_16455 [Clostridium aestuarii]|uniref:Uncharacterized protein n=1 Tax=Clostridium aestuarii TaxID=338193 RepID=A0ABT4D3T3_9CLOT|nr:hypothetical protein [Clostridium aestuarii]MCY6485904.1 hypothetical protein [Clostridium aestuarii]